MSVFHKDRVAFSVKSDGLIDLFHFNQARSRRMLRGAQPIHNEVPIVRLVSKVTTIGVERPATAIVKPFRESVVLAQFGGQPSNLEIKKDVLGS